jgi:hypothetical protein
VIVRLECVVRLLARLLAEAEFSAMLSDDALKACLGVQQDQTYIHDAVTTCEAQVCTACALICLEDQMLLCILPVCCAPTLLGTRTSEAWLDTRDSAEPTYALQVEALKKAGCQHADRVTKNLFLKVRWKPTIPRDV